MCQVCEDKRRQREKGRAEKEQRSLNKAEGYIVHTSGGRGEKGIKRCSDVDCVAGNKFTLEGLEITCASPDMY